MIYKGIANDKSLLNFLKAKGLSSSNIALFASAEEAHIEDVASNSALLTCEERMILSNLYLHVHFHEFESDNKYIKIPLHVDSP